LRAGGVPLTGAQGRAYNCPQAGCQGEEEDSRSVSAAKREGVWLGALSGGPAEDPL